MHWKLLHSTGTKEGLTCKWLWTGLPPNSVVITSGSSQSVQHKPVIFDTCVWWYVVILIIFFCHAILLHIFMWIGYVPINQKTYTFILKCFKPYIFILHMYTNVHCKIVWTWFSFQMLYISLNLDLEWLPSSNNLSILWPMNVKGSIGPVLWASVIFTLMLFWDLYFTLFTKCIPY